MADALRRRGLTGSIKVLVLFVVLAAGWTFPAWAHVPPRLVEGPGVSDAPEQAWLLTWVPFSLSHGWSPFITRAFDYPTGANLLWPGAPLVLALLIWPITAILGPISAYDAAMVIAIATAAFSGYLCCRRWVQRRAAAVGGGVIFGFSPFVTGQTSGHLVYVAVAMVPLMVLGLDDLLVRTRWSARRAGALLGLLALVQLVTAEEILAGAALTAAVGGAVLALMHPRAARTRIIRAVEGLGWAGAIVVLGGAYPIWFQFAGPAAIHGHLLTGSSFSANLAELVVPGYQQAVTTPATAAFVAALQGHSGEVGAYLGLPMMALLVALWRSRPAGPSRFVCVMAAVTAVLTLGPVLRLGPLDTHIPLPEAILAHIPGLQALLPVRLSVDLDLFAALAFALYLDPLSRRAIDRWPRVLVLLTAACWLPTLTAPSLAAPLPRFFTSSQSSAWGVLLVLPVAENANSDLPMLWQAASNMRFAMPEGYYHVPRMGGGSIFGPAFTPFTAALTNIFLGDTPPVIIPTLRRDGRAYLRTHHVTAVVAGPEPHRRRAVEFVSAVLMQAPVTSGGVEIWRLGGRRGPGLPGAGLSAIWHSSVARIK